MENTPRRVTRSFLAAQSASKGTAVASPAASKHTPSRKTPAAKNASSSKTLSVPSRTVKVHTPTASTGKRGRPRKTVKKPDEETKENIPDSNVTASGNESDNKESGGARRVLHLTHEINSISDENKDATVAIPEIKVIEDSFIAGAPKESEIHARQSIDYTESSDYPNVSLNENPTFDETLALSTLEMNCVSDKKMIENGIIEDLEKNDPDAQDLDSPIKVDDDSIEKMEQETPILIKDDSTSESIDVSNETLSHTNELGASQHMELCKTLMSETEPGHSKTTVDEEDMVIDAPTNEEDELISKLCAEVKDYDVPSTSETTLNETFELDEAVFDTPMPEKTTGVTTFDTIVIEDTPAKPKTPKITMRRPFQKQQKLDVPEVLSVSCVTAEKSILKRKKRSLSTGDIGNFTMQHDRRVKFNSPANMSVQINEIDERMLQSYTENNGRDQRAARRKRSLSDADYTEVKAQKVETGKRMFKSKKMPDFAAIHAKQISKMESLTENLARKQERALYLITPEGKKDDEAQKGQGSSKKELKFAGHSDVLVNKESEPNLDTTEPIVFTSVDYVEEEKLDKAIDEEELGEPEDIDEMEVQSEPESASNVVQISKPVKSISAPIDSKTRPMAAIQPQKSFQRTQFKNKFNFGAPHPTKVAGQSTPAFKFAAKSTIAEIEKGSNAIVKPVNLSERIQNAMPSTSALSDFNTHPHNTTTRVNREEQHRNMYKANRLRANVRNGGILKGVRLNKRFALQMVYRDSQMKRD